jgi:4-amino-4-deoxy-L-arabinose transferase-like glycosyltransferase
MSKLISQGEAGAAFSLSFFNLYRFITAIFQKVFNEWELSAQMVSAVFSSLTSIPFYFLIRSLLGRTVTFISSILFIFHPYLVRYSAEVIQGPTFWFFPMMTLWVGWEAISRKRAWLFFS